MGSCSAQARFVRGLPSQKSGAFGQETELFGRRGLACCLRWCKPHPLNGAVIMALKNRVLDSACHLGEQDCGARPIMEVWGGALAKRQAQRRGGNRRGIRGLLLRNGVWHIDKVLFGKRICESTRTGDLSEH